MFWTSPDQRDPLFSHKWYILFANFKDKKEYNLYDYVFGLKECSKPSYDISVTEHRHISGHVFRYPGTLKWKPIQIKFASVNTQYWTDYYSNKAKNKSYWNGFWDSLFPDKIIRERITEKNFESYSLAYFLEHVLKKNFSNPDQNTNGIATTTTNESGARETRTSYLTNYQNISKQNYDLGKVSIIQLDDSGDEQEVWELHNPFISSANYGMLSYENEQIVEISLTLQYDWAIQRDIVSFKDNFNYTYSPPNNQG